jgi:hypothetical protein
MTPPPLPSHLGIGARHTGHLHKYQVTIRISVWDEDPQCPFRIPSCKGGNSHARCRRSYSGEQALTAHNVTAWCEGRIGG